jgi:hypothetical protein
MEVHGHLAFKKSREPERIGVQPLALTSGEC